SADSPNSSMNPNMTSGNPIIRNSPLGSRTSSRQLASASSRNADSLRASGAIGGHLLAAVERLPGQVQKHVFQRRLGNLDVAWRRRQRPAEQSRQRRVVVGGFDRE